MPTIDPRYTPEKRLKTWVPLHKVAFADWVAKTFQYSSTDKESSLFHQQRFVRDFIQPDSPYRGILLYHGLGVGKTAASIAASEPFLGLEGRGICVMLPASLRQNFIGEIQRYGNRVFSVQQHWSFYERDDVDADMLDDMRLEEAKYVLTSKRGKKTKGLWVPEEDEAPNFSRLSAANQKNIRRQMSDMINGYYNFLHYNGVNTKKIHALTKNNKINPFDGKVVIIDEVHNFVSRVVNKGKTAPILYSLLMSASNCKIIMLSGTPLINYPHEIAFLLNLARGNLEFHHFHYLQRPKPVFDALKVEAYLKKSPFISNAMFQDQKISAQLLPEGFEYTADRKAIKRSGATHDEVVKGIIKDLRELKVNLKSSAWTKESKELLPTDDERFNSYFVDFEGVQINNPELLTRRIQGVISYYHAYSKDLYPSTAPLEILEFPMSEHQYNKYALERDKERKNEERARLNAKKRKDVDDKNMFKNNGNIYRCFSRSVCNFVFPASIKRPYPSTIRRFKQEMDDADDATAKVTDEDGNDGNDGNDDGEDPDDEDPGRNPDEDPSRDPAEALAKGRKQRADGADADGDADGTYEEQIGAALRALRAGGQDFLGLDALAMFSPKFKHVVESAHACPGPMLVYSQFRTIEGIGVLSMALDANGFEELKVVRDANTGEWDLDLSESDADKLRYVAFQSDPEFIQVVLNIFNNNFDALPKRITEKVDMLCRDAEDGNKHGQVLKVLMITQSGSEGISLKNVREVHILEPYWNLIRVNQVIGRAVRANSHTALPKDEWNVKAFMYTSVFAEGQCRGTQLEIADGGNTSDQYIYGVASRKAKIMDQLLAIMRDAAVDCRLHRSAHQDAKCYSFSANFAPDDDAYNPDIDHDTRDNVYRAAKVVKTIDELQLKVGKFADGKRFAYDPSTMILYDADKAARQEIEAVGVVKVVKGMMTYKLYANSSR